MNKQYSNNTFFFRPPGFACYKSLVWNLIKLIQQVTFSARTMSAKVEVRMVGQVDWCRSSYHGRIINPQSTLSIKCIGHIYQHIYYDMIWMINIFYYNIIIIILNLLIDFVHCRKTKIYCFNWLLIYIEYASYELWFRCQTYDKNVRRSYIYSYLPPG